MTSTPAALLRPVDARTRAVDASAARQPTTFLVQPAVSSFFSALQADFCSVREVRFCASRPLPDHASEGMTAADSGEADEAQPSSDKVRPICLLTSCSSS